MRREKSCGRDLLLEADQGEENVETGAAIEFAFNLDLASMFLHDSMDDRQPKACPIVFSREEGIKYMRHIIGFDSHPIVFDRDPKNLTHTGFCAGKSGRPCFGRANLRRNGE